MHKLSFDSKYFVPRKLDEIEKYEKMWLQRILSQEIAEGDLDLRENQFITDLGNIKEVRGSLDLSKSSIKSLSRLEKVEGNLNLYSFQIEDLGNLKYVGGSLNLFETPIKSLKNLEYVGGNLYLENSQIEDLGNLKYVGRSLNLLETPIKSLKNLEYVGGNLDLENSQIEDLGNLKYVGGWLCLNYTPLSKRFKFKEELEQYVRSKVKVKEGIYA
jgi:hypothetical protein